MILAINSALEINLNDDISSEIYGTLSKFEIKDENEFIDALGKILKSDTISQVVTTLIKLAK